MNHLIPNFYGEYEVVQNTTATQDVPEADPTDRLQRSHGKNVFRQLQDNQEADYDKKYKKSFSRDV